MHKSPAHKLPVRKLLATVIAGTLFLPSLAYTLGLGEIEVNSALNQKLNADIELLSAAEEDTENIIVKLASRKEFARAGIDRPYLLSDLNFKAVVIDGKPHIKITSGSPIREPYLNFLVEVDWPNGHMLREYTILLDPPVFMMQPASTATPAVNQNAEFRPAASKQTGGAAPVVAAGNSGRPALSQAPAPVTTQPATAPQAAAPAYIPAPSVQQQAVLSQRAGQYRIKSGDTAWSLADAMRPDRSVSVEQMMIAMLRANPESFINENINGLKRGYILRIPDYNQISSISHAEARELVREQAALWRQMTQAQRGGEPVSAMPAGDAGADGGDMAASQDDARLAIVSAGSGSSALGEKDPTEMSAEELRAELALARERVETERVEKEALLQRIRELEQGMNKMKGMLAIEDDQLSEVQALNMPADEATESGIDPQAEQELQEVLGELADTADAGAEAGDEASPAETEAAAEEEVSVTETETVEETTFVDEETGEEVTDIKVTEEVEIRQPAPKPAPAPIVSRPQPDPLSRILNDPMLLAGAGGGLLLLVALIALIIKRRKAANDEEEAELNADLAAGDDMAGVADDLSEDAEEAAGEPEEESTVVTEAADSDGDFDADATMVLDAQDTVVTEAPEELPEEPRDDVIAEADVYLAYGIYQQAEELLTQAIADNPDRDDYRLKLAETYYAAKNADAFLKVAEELHKRADGNDTPEWKKVMVMGQDLCADNLLFQGSMVGGLDVDSLAPKAPEMDLDLGADDGQSEAADGEPDLDLSLDEPLDPVAPDDGAEAGGADEPEAAAEDVAEIEFDLEDTGAVVDESAEDEFSLDIDAGELDIDIQDEEQTETEEESLELDAVDLGLDLDAETTDSGDEITEVEDVDLDFGLDEATAAVEGDETDKAADEDEEISLDLTDEAEAMDFDLSDEPAADEEAATQDVAADDAPAVDVADASEDEDEFDLSNLDDVDEISTKLDLARAYFDMGDHEGARSILEEVQADGNDAQKQEAEELMAKLEDG